MPIVEYPHLPGDPLGNVGPAEVLGEMNLVSEKSGW